MIDKSRVEWITDNKLHRYYGPAETQLFFAHAWWLHGELIKFDVSNYTIK